MQCTASSRQWLGENTAMPLSRAAPQLAQSSVRRCSSAPILLLLTELSADLMTARKGKTTWIHDEYQHAVRLVNQGRLVLIPVLLEPGGTTEFFSPDNVVDLTADQRDFRKIDSILPPAPLALTERQIEELSRAVRGVRSGLPPGTVGRSRRRSAAPRPSGCGLRPPVPPHAALDLYRRPGGTRCRPATAPCDLWRADRVPPLFGLLRRARDPEPGVSADLLSESGRAGADPSWRRPSPGRSWSGPTAARPLWALAGERAQTASARRAASSSAISASMTSSSASPART